MLKTFCNNCIFYSPVNGCVLSKPQKNGNIDGFCNYRRSWEWARRKNLDTTPDITAKTLKIYEEESVLTLVILCLDNNIKKLKQTLETVKKLLYINNILVITNNLKKHKKKFIKTLIKYNITWILDDFRLDEKISKLDIITNSLLKLKTSWFFCIEAGDTPSQDTITKISNSARDKNDNTVLYYVDEFDVFRIGTHQYIFENLSGNVEIPFFDKIKSFSNWKELCQKLPEK